MKTLADEWPTIPTGAKVIVSFTGDSARTAYIVARNRFGLPHLETARDPGVVVAYPSDCWHVEWEGVNYERVPGHGPKVWAESPWRPWREVVTGKAVAL